MVGRPSIYTDELVESLCHEVATGRSVREICADDDWAPAESTFYAWLAKYDSFSEKYARAKERQQDVELEKIIRIADESTPETVSVDRLRIDTRKWAMSKLAPKKYGDKLAIGGSKDMDPIETNETGQGIQKLLGLVNGIAERSGNSGDESP